MNQWPQPVRFPTDTERLALVADFRATLSQGDGKAVEYIGHQPNRFIEPQAMTALEERIRAQFQAPGMEIILTGSASLGFSPIAKPHLGKSAWRGFSEQSDVDLAIVHDETFDQHWIASYRQRLRGGPWPNLEAMQSYFFAGWFRPDLAPSTFALRNNWFDFFGRLSSDILEFPISAGLYRSHEFLNEYRLKTCRAARQY